jgi:hypothetical protein
MAIEVTGDTINASAVLKKIEKSRLVITTVRELLQDSPDCSPRNGNLSLGVVRPPLVKLV